VLLKAARQLAWKDGDDEEAANPISLGMLWRSRPGGSLRAVSNSFAAIASSSCSLSARISPSPPAPALRVAAPKAKGK
jgi:hypothetical protein